MRILVVDDEVELCDSIAEGLRMDGYATDVCYSGSEAQELLLTQPYDLAVLDLNLPGMDGIKVLKELRRQAQEVKVLILSARDTVSDKVLGLDIGANDYLAKPFDFAELEARIRGLLRRSFAQENAVLTFGDISLDTVARNAVVNGVELSLTRKELALLEYFMHYPRKVISQEELMDHVWDREADSFSNAVRVHIASLRKKLRAVLPYDAIATKIGEGYFLVEAQETQ